MFTVTIELSAKFEIIANIMISKAIYLTGDDIFSQDNVQSGKKGRSAAIINEFNNFDGNSCKEPAAK